MLRGVPFTRLVIALLSISGVAGAGLQGNDKAYTIAAKYTVGEVLKYKMTTNLKMDMTAEGSQAPLPSGDLLMSMVLAYKTVKADDKGGATIVATTSHIKGTAFGQSSAPKEVPPVTMDVDSRGMSRSVQGLEKTQGAQALQQMFDFKSMPSSGLYYPDHPVKVGDTWTGEIALTAGSKKAKVSAQLVSVDQVDGKEQYKVKQTWTVPVEMMMGSDGPTTDPDKAVTVISGEIVSVGNVLVAGNSGRVIRLVNDVDGKLGIELKGPLAQQAPFTKMNLKLGGQAGMAPATPADEAEPAPAVKKTGAGTTKGSSGRASGTQGKVKTKGASGKGVSGVPARLN